MTYLVSLKTLGHHWNLRSNKKTTTKKPLGTVVTESNPVTSKVLINTEFSLMISWCWQVLIGDLLVCSESCYSWQLFKTKLTLMSVNFHEHEHFHFNTQRFKLTRIIWLCGIWRRSAFASSQIQTLYCSFLIWEEPVVMYNLLLQVKASKMWILDFTACWRWSWS